LEEEVVYSELYKKTAAMLRGYSNGIL